MSAAAKSRRRHRMVRPARQLPTAPRRIGRAELEELTAGPLAGRETADAIEIIVSAQAALDILDARLAHDGTLTTHDMRDYATRCSALEAMFRRLRLPPDAPRAD